MIRPCRHTLTPSLRAEWVGHLCGLCLALRDGHGQLARVATNYDGLLISVLVDAQTARRTSRGAGPCPLRGMRGATVAVGEGPRLAAVVSLVLASATLADHAADGDGALARRRLARAAGRLSGRWSRAAAVDGARLGLNTGVLLDAVARQPAVERSAASLFAATEPTEAATAAAFAHTAVLAGRPGNAAALAEVGRLFGRLAHLLDAVQDRRDDVANSAWNPLVATGTDLATARGHADDAVLGVRLALRDVECDRAALVHRLLAHEPARAVDHAFAHAGGEEVDRTRRPADPDPPRGRGLLAGCAAAVGLCCTCRLCCAEEFPGPWSGKRREGLCAKGDCCDGDGCADCCDCDCCDCNC